MGQPDKGYPGRMNASVFRFLLRAGVALLVLTAMARVAAATGGDGWPTLSHDAQRTARSTGTGVITAAPTVAWQRIMGGALGSRQLLTADVDGDGKTEALLVSAGRVVARKDNNGQLWASPHIGAFAVIAVANLDGKGGDELVALGSSPRGLYLFDAKTGAQLWYAATTSSAVQALAVASGGAYRVLLAEQLGTLRAYDFAAGLIDSQTNLLWTNAASPWSTDLVVADVDGDNAPDIVRGRDKGFVVHDFASGAVRCDASQITAALVAPSYFPALSAADVDGDGRDEIVAYDFSYYYSEDASLYVVSCNGSGATLSTQIRMQQQWVGDVTPGPGNDVHRYQIRYLANAVAELDGSLPREIVYSLWDQQGGSWTTYVRNAATGALLDSRSGEALEAVGDVDDDGVAELMLREASDIAQSRLPKPYFSTLRAYDFDSKTFVDKGWTRSGARVAWVGAHHSLAVTAGAGAVAARQNVDGAAHPAIETYVYLEPAMSSLGDPAPGSIVSLRGTDGVVLGAFPFPQDVSGELLRLTSAMKAPGAESESLVMLYDGGLRLLSDQMTEVGKLLPGNYARLPTVTSLDGMTNTIFVVSSSSALLAIDGTQLDTNEPVELWRYPHALQPEGRGYVSAPGMRLPNAGSPSGKLVVRAHLSTNFEEFAVVSLSANGTVGWETALGAGNVFVSFDNLELLDDLDSDNTADFFIQQLDSLNNQRMVIRSGATGATMVHRATADLFPPGGTFLQGHAATDLNADGKLDIVAALHPGSFVGIDVSKAGSGNPSTGFEQIFRVAAPPNGQAMVGQLDADPQLDLLRHNSQNASGSYQRRDLSTGVVQASYLAPHPSISGTDANAAAFVARPNAPGAFDHVWAGMAGDALGAVARLDGTSLQPVWFVYLVGGASLPQSPIPAGRSALYSPIAADIDGDGSDEILVGSIDGYLYALSVADGSIEFAVQLGGPVVHLIAADIDKDADLELLASLGDGRLLALDLAGSYDADDVTPPPMPDAGPDSGSGGVAGGLPTGGTGGSGGSSSASSGQGGASTGGHSAGGAGAAGPGATTIDAGCGCRLTNSAGQHVAWLLGLLALIGLARRRRG